MRFTCAAFTIMQGLLRPDRLRTQQYARRTAASADSMLAAQVTLDSAHLHALHHQHERLDDGDGLVVARAANSSRLSPLSMTRTGGNS
jgi:hypothetical protein